MHVDGMLYLNAGVVKRALDNRLTFSLNVYNITGQKLDMYAYGDNYRKHTVNREGGGTQNLSFSVRWNFKSGKNVKVKKAVPRRSATDCKCLKPGAEKLFGKKRPKDWRLVKKLYICTRIITNKNVKCRETSASSCDKKK